MNMAHFDLTDLKPAKVYVRKTGGKDVDDLVRSIGSLVSLQPLLIRPDCEGYKIIAGQRRYHALVRVAEDTAIDSVPCVVMEDGDVAKAIEASLAENVARLPMDKIDQYRAFPALIKAGWLVEDIAVGFGIAEWLVHQRLAIANLVPSILALDLRDMIGGETVRTLTMATKTQQRRWL